MFLSEAMTPTLEFSVTGAMNIELAGAIIAIVLVALLAARELIGLSPLGRTWVKRTMTLVLIPLFLLFVMDAAYIVLR